MILAMLLSILSALSVTSSALGSFAQFETEIMKRQEISPTQGFAGASAPA
jgi:hypothetical protein